MKGSRRPPVRRPLVERARARSSTSPIPRPLKQWWQDEVRQVTSPPAPSGFKDDDGEGNFFGNVKFADGTDPRVMRNRYAVLYATTAPPSSSSRRTSRAMAYCSRCSVTHRRPNGIGFLWGGGDNEASFSALNGLPTVITAGLGAGLSGMPLWTLDLGGYRRHPALRPTLRA